MSIKKPQESVPQKPAWDINDQMVRQRLRQFQSDLALIVRDDPETAGDEVSFFCLKKGYWPKWLVDSTYFQIERRQYGTIWKKRIECNTTNPNVESAREMYRALQKLMDKERYAKKMEHQDQLAGQECMGKPGTENRCLICYPETNEEVFAKMGYEPGARPGTRTKIIDAMKVPEGKPTQPIKIEKLEVLPVDPRVDVIENKNNCEKCGEPRAHCECLREEDLPF